MSEYKGFPSQRLSNGKKNRKWRERCVDWADKKLVVSYNYIRNSLRHKIVNYDLLNGKLHMSDLQTTMNPSGIRAEFVPDTITHYPIMLSKINVLRGEESKRVFDYRVVVTNPTAISDMEVRKQKLLVQELQQLIQETSESEDDFNKRLEEVSDHYYYNYQDEREIRASSLLNHYSKEYNMPLLFNTGFVDAMAVAEEIYRCDIVGGEPVLERLNPKKVNILKSGYSNRVEDADMIIIDDYWNPGRVIETYGEVLTDKDVKYIEEGVSGDTSGYVDSMDTVDERYGFVNAGVVATDRCDPCEPLQYVETFSTSPDFNAASPFDANGNVRVVNVYWKSYKYILKVKSYDPVTGKENYDLYNEDYLVNSELGEEVVEKFPILEAWEGTKIGGRIYVNMRPRVIQYNSLTNPSRCHFGIIGSFYNINEERNYSLVDMMKQYNYLYDVIHDRLNRLIARNWGRLIRLDVSKKPNKWSVDKWFYYAKQMGIVVEDSFNAADEGPATGRIAGSMNNNSTGMIDAELGNTIQQYINLLEFIKMEMSEVAGITKQREGQISNRETVGGVERATLQSSHITEWLFVQHEDLKKRVLEAFIETAKIAMRGGSKKFHYILPDGSMKLMEIDGDEFAESDYGLIVDSSQQTQEFASKLDMYAQAAMQNQLTSFSTIFKLYGTASLAEKQRIVEKDERDIQQRQQQAQQEQMQSQQQIEQAKMELENQKMALEDQMNQRDNDTKIMIAAMSSQNENDGIVEPEYSQESRDKLAETIREFDERLQLDKDRLELDRKKVNADISIKKEKKNKS